MAKDKNAQLGNLIAGYNDAIRLSDIKALIAESATRTPPSAAPLQAPRPSA